MPEFESFEHVPVLHSVLTPQVPEESCSSTDHGEQATPGSVILGMGFKVLC